MKKILKVFGTISLVGILENIVILLIYGVDVFTKQNLLILLLSSITLTLLLKQLGLTREC